MEITCFWTSEARTVNRFLLSFKCLQGETMSYADNRLRKMFFSSETFMNSHIHFSKSSNSPDIGFIIVPAGCREVEGQACTMLCYYNEDGNNS